MPSPHRAHSGRCLLSCLTPACFPHAVTTQERLSALHIPPLTYKPAPLLLHPCYCQEAWAKCPGLPGSHFHHSSSTVSYLVQLHLIRCSPPSSWAAGALICWHNHNVVPPGKERNHKHWTLSHLSGRSPNNVPYTSQRQPVPSLPWVQEGRGWVSSCTREDNTPISPH